MFKNEKASKNKRFSLCSWGHMGKDGHWNDKQNGPLLLPLLRWPLSDPPVQKLLFRPLHFGTTFSVV